MTPIKLDIVHPPLSKCLSINIKMSKTTWISCTCLCAIILINTKLESQLVTVVCQSLDTRWKSVRICLKFTLQCSIFTKPTVIHHQIFITSISPSTNHQHVCHFFEKSLTYTKLRICFTICIAPKTKIYRYFVNSSTEVIFPTVPMQATP